MTNNHQRFIIKVPGSSANLGAGFDSFGLALPLYLTIKIQRAEKTVIKLIGEHLSTLPNNQDNLIYKTIEHLFSLENEVVPPIAMEVESDIPLARGLGSSGSAIIGGLLAANQLLKNPKTIDQLFQIAVKLEGHADNVGASLYGGFVVTAYDGLSARAEKLPFPEDLKIILAIPDYSLPTNVAREQIPEAIPLKDTAYNIGYASLFIAYILTGQIEKLITVMKDQVHQPYRQKAVKGLSKLITMGEESGNFGAVLSGAGPTILLLAKSAQVAAAEKTIKELTLELDFEMIIKTVCFSKNGAELLVN